MSGLNWRDAQYLIELARLDAQATEENIAFQKQHGMDSSFEEQQLDMLRRDIFALEEGLPYDQDHGALPFDEVHETKFRLRFG